jgi:hypothetical protein
LGEFAVNTRTSDGQTDAAVAMDANENFVVVWSSYRGDGDSGAIFARRFDANCKSVGDEFQINTTTAGNQTEPAVAMEPNGNFVVVWHGPGETEEDKEDVFGQRFDANGQTIGGEFLVNTTTFSRQQYPQVAVNEGGGFVVVWENEQLGGEPLEAWGICGQLYDSNGSLIGGEFDINLLLQCRYPDVAMNSSGEFVVAWMQDDIYHTYNLVMSRQYNANGTAKSDPCELNTGVFYSLTRPSIAIDESGRFVVAWDAHPVSASEDDIYARLYAADGTAMGGEFVVNTTMAYGQHNPSVSKNGAGEFVVVWQSDTDANGLEENALAQRYDSAGSTVGDESVMNTYIVDRQRYADVVMGENGKFVAVWQSDGQDRSGYGVFGEVGPRVGCADFSWDSFVNFSDYCVLAGEWLEEGGGLETDLIDDNRIDERDLDALCRQWLMSCYDCNEVDIYSDGRIDFRDYGLWAGNWLKQGPGLDGDVTGDGVVDLADLRAMVFHWAKSCE